jgi:dTDP-4-amino-4,6-dideoxygalactose transaminase
MVKIIRLSKSVIGNEEKTAVLKVLEKEFLGMGEEVDKFEKKLSKIFKRSTVCVSSGTSAIQLSLEACNIGKNDEVLVPSLTYVATFQAIKATGAIPIPCDVDEDNLLIDIEDAKSKITNRTKAIIPVHYTGGVGDLNSLYEFAQKNKIRVIEDAAHAFGTIYNSNLIGSIGDIVCFSFDGIKNITSGEGGCIISNDKKIIERVQNSRLLGVENDSKSRYKNARSWDFNVKRQGWRYHMSNLMAAIGIEQLKKRDLFFSKRKLLAVKYDQLFQNVKDIFYH